MPVQLHLLGTPRFFRDEQPVELNAAKAIALLALLALTRPAQSREHVIGLLWAESAAAAARKNMRNTLWTIRKSLGDGVIQADSDRLALPESVWVDAREISDLRFQNSEITHESDIANLKAKVELYHGPLLEGFALGDSPEFELWLTGERERLSQTYLRALARLVEDQRGRHAWHDMIDAAQRALTEDNLQEPMVRALMEAHAHLGERAEALREYEALRTVLARELGVAPLPETDALRAQVLHGDFEPPVERSAGRPSAARPRAAPSATPFVGRQRELALLHAEAQTALSVGARVVELAGEVGIGKTRLWHEWLASLAPDEHRIVLQAHCLEATQSLPFAPVIELFSRPAAPQRLFRSHSSASPVWLAEVARLIPDLRMRVPHLPVPPALPADEERRRLFEGFAQCLLALEARPLIIVLDDVHWIDGATLDWLGFIVDRLREQPLLLVMTYRPADAPAALVQRSAQWARAGVLAPITLDHLTQEESAALVTALGGDAALAERAQSQGGGNPYFLVELVQSPTSDIPLALTELLRARIAKLSELARQVLQAAAILDSDFSESTLSQTSGRSESETLDALDELVHAAELTESDGTYSFAHPLIATVVRDGLSGPRRAFLHRRAAAALESTGAHAAQAGRIATHYALGNDSARAAHFFDMAAEHALGVAAPSEAVRFYEQALRNEPTALRRMGLGTALWRLGELAAARMAFKAAYDEFVSAGDRRHAAQVSLNLAESYLVAQRVDDGRDWMERGLGNSDPETDPASHALAHLLSGSSQLEHGELVADAERHLVEAVRIAAEHRLPQMEGRARFILANLYAERGDLSLARQGYSMSIALADAAGDDLQAVLSRNNAAFHALLDGDLAAAHGYVESGLAQAETTALRTPLQYLYSTRGEIALAEEQFAEAAQWFKRALAEAERNENDTQIANTHMNLGLVARARGEVDEALLQLNRAREEAARQPVPNLQAQIVLHLAELYWQQGARAAAEESLAQAEVLLTGGVRKRLVRWAQQLRLQMT